MRHDVPTEECQETAALYALGALGQHEARAFEAHLRDGCDVCRRELDTFADVTGALGSGIAEVAPPAFLRDVLTARIEKENELHTGGRSREAQVYLFPEKAPQTKPLQKPRSPFRTFLPWAVAAGLVLALGFTALMWRSDRNGLRLANQQAQNELTELANREAARARELDEINGVLASAHPSVIALAGQPVAPSASANVYWDHQKNRWVVSANLPAPPAGKVYQLWFVTPDAKVSAGLIEADQRGHGFTVVNIPPTVIQIQAAAITLEPQGGSLQPTMPIYAVGAPAS